MKRSRPKQHTRVIKTKRGRRRRITINKGVRKRTVFSREQYGFVRGVIKNKQKENIVIAREFDRVSEKDPLTISEKSVRSDRLSDFKRRLAINTQTIDLLNQKYFPKNPT